MQFDTFTLEIRRSALTARLSHDPPEAVSASVEPVPSVLRPRAGLLRELHFEATSCSTEKSSRRCVRLRF